jgi:putative membrane protein
MNAEGKEQKVIQFNGNGSVKAFLNNGLTVDVTPDASGLLEVQQAQAGTTYFMARR